MTSLTHTRATIILILGDLIAYVFSLIFALTIRYGSVPSRGLFMSHAPSFLALFAVFLLVSFSAGLYDKPGIIRNRASWLLIRVQIVNLIIGVVYFYFVSAPITPKTNLLIYIAVSTVVLLIWRAIMFPVVNVSRTQPMILVGEGDDIDDLHQEVDTHPRHGISFREVIRPTSSVQEMVSRISGAVQQTKASTIVADLHDPRIEAAIPFLYSLVFSGVQVVDAGKMYESIFDRIPLSMVGQRWLVEHSSSALGNRRVYDATKRLMDIVVASLVGVISLVLYPFVCLAIKIDDGGPIFITQERIGKNGKVIRMTKFRSMTSNDSGSYVATGGKSTLRVTRVGRFIRMTRIDELPQLWSVIRGDQSLIGPRPELPALVGLYEKEISYYNARHLIKPGLSGWAQIYHRAHPHHAVAVDDTRDKLSYDLYYVKHRSLALDIRIALQTAKSILSKQGV